VGGSGSLLLLVRGGVCSVLARKADFMGDHATNNFAEFSGMVNGLQLALDFLKQSAEPTPGLRLTVTATPSWSCRPCSRAGRSATPR
jgi:hypothetical protein